MSSQKLKEDDEAAKEEQEERKLVALEDIAASLRASAPEIQRLNRRLDNLVDTILAASDFTVTVQRDVVAQLTGIRVAVESMVSSNPPHNDYVNISRNQMFL